MVDGLADTIEDCSPSVARATKNPVLSNAAAETAPIAAHAARPLAEEFGVGVGTGGGAALDSDTNAGIGGATGGGTGPPYCGTPPCERAFGVQGEVMVGGEGGSEPVLGGGGRVTVGDSPVGGAVGKTDSLLMLRNLPRLP